MNFDSIKVKPKIDEHKIFVHSIPVMEPVYKKKKKAGKKLVVTTLTSFLCFTVLSFGVFTYFNFDSIKKQLGFNPTTNIQNFSQIKAKQTQDNNQKEVLGTSTEGLSQNIFKPTDYYIEIPKLNIIGNVVETDSMDKVNGLLDKGLVHLPGTVSPGESGSTMFIGHSSSYHYGYYANIFSTLNKLATDDVIILNKGTSTFVYKVYNKEVIEPKLEAVKTIPGEEDLVLLTCWPIGTNQQRLAVYAKRIK